MLIKYLTIILFFVSIALSYWTLPVKAGGAQWVTYSLIFQIIFIVLLIVFSPKRLFWELKNLYKHTCIKFFLSFLVVVLLSGIINAFIGNGAGIFKVLINFLSRILRFCLPLFCGYLIIKLYKNRFILQLLYKTIVVILIFAFIDFIIFKFNIGFLQNAFLTLISTNGAQEKAMSGGIPRMQSFFGEPSFLGYFLVLFLPITFYISFSKIKVYTNKWINYAIKKICPIASFVVLLGTLSPIYIIFGIIAFFLYISTLKKFSIKKSLWVGAGTIITGIIILNLIFYFNHNIENIMLLRIQKTLSSFTNISDLVINEPSLATRIVGYINLLQIAINKPIIGCGIANLNAYMYNSFLHSNFPLTEEIAFSLINEKLTMNSNIFFQTFAESGSLAIILLYAFIERLYNYVKKCFAIAISKNELKVLKSLALYLIYFVCLSFYNSNIYLSYIWIMFGVIIGYCDNLKNRKIIIKTR